MPAAEYFWGCGTWLAQGESPVEQAANLSQRSENRANAELRCEARFVRMERTSSHDGQIRAAPTSLLFLLISRHHATTLV
jgi:hypothetical protein